MVELSSRPESSRSWTGHFCSSPQARSRSEASSPMEAWMPNRAAGSERASRVSRVVALSPSRPAIPRTSGSAARGAANSAAARAEARPRSTPPRSLAPWARRRADSHRPHGPLRREQGGELLAGHGPLQRDDRRRAGPERGQRRGRGERLHVRRTEPVLHRAPESLPQRPLRSGVARRQPREAQERSRRQVGVGVHASRDQEPPVGVDLPVARLRGDRLPVQRDPDDLAVLDDDRGAIRWWVAHEPGPADDEAGGHGAHPLPARSPRKAWGFPGRPLRDLSDDVELISFRHQTQETAHDP